MKRVLATAAVAASLLSGCSAPYSAGAPSVFNEGPASASSEAPPSPDAAAFTAAAAPEPVEPVRQGEPPSAKTDFEVLDELMFDTISAKYSAVGVTLDKAAYDGLLNHICSDMRQRGPGYFTTGDLSALAESGKQALARSTWLVMAGSCYPKDFRLNEADLDEVADFLADLAPEYQRRLEAAGLSSSSSAPGSTGSEYAGSGSTDYGSGSTDYGSGSTDYGSGSTDYGSGSTDYGSGYADYGTGSDVSRSYGSPGSGYSVQCIDGSFSSSGGKRGACSWHGGVSR